MPSKVGTSRPGDGSRQRSMAADTVPGSAAGLIVVRHALDGDGAAIADIYNPYVRETVVTFEAEPVSAAEMTERIGQVASQDLPWLVAERAGQVAGFAYAMPWKDRAAYRHTVEISVYVHPRRGRQGIGSALYEALFPLLQDRGIHAVLGGIALPNETSVAFHERFGLRKVAHLEQVGYKLGRWVDVGYWQRILLD